MFIFISPVYWKKNMDVVFEVWICDIYILNILFIDFLFLYLLSPLQTNACDVHVC